MKRARRIFGEKGSAAFASTGSKNLDLWNSAVRDLPKDRLYQLLSAAWSESPSTCLRLIFNLGESLQGKNRSGKSDTKGFEAAMMWMYRNHPETFLINVARTEQFTCMKSLLNITQEAMMETVLVSQDWALVADFVRRRKLKYDRYDADQQKVKRDEAEQDYDDDEEEYDAATNGTAETTKKSNEEAAFAEACVDRKSQQLQAFRATVDPETLELSAKDKSTMRELRKAYRKYCDDANKKKSAAARVLWKSSHDAFAAQARRSFLAPPTQASSTLHRLVHIVACFFARGLERERHAVDNCAVPSERFSGLFAKWCPTPRGMHDLNTGGIVVDIMIEQLYPRETHFVPDGLEEVYRSRMRSNYRQLLSRLRGHAHVPEHFIGSGQWSQVDYRRMAARCRLLYGEMFKSHDRDRYMRFLEDAKKAVLDRLSKKTSDSTKDAAKVSGKGVLPFQLVERALRNQRSIYQSNFQDESQRELDAELSLQWLAMIEPIRRAGVLGNCLALCDVSGSMYGDPINNAIGLSLIIAELASPAWRGKVLTFESAPRLMSLPMILPTPHPREQEEGSTLSLGSFTKLVETTFQLPWGGSTNFAAALQLLLSHAKAHQLSNSEMPSRLFIFSDMEFDRANSAANGGESGVWATHYEKLQDAFQKAGYQLPEIVFWNLRDSVSVPVTGEQRGCVLVCGSSPACMQLFLRSGKVLNTPLAVLGSLLYGKRTESRSKKNVYDLLQVFPDDDIKDDDLQQYLRELCTELDSTDADGLDQTDVAKCRAAPLLLSA